MKIIVAGDIHGDFQAVNSLVQEENPDYILQVGDFGYYPNEHPGWPPTEPELKLGNTCLHWCDGNHEDHQSLSQLIKVGELEVAPNCFYQPRGTTLTLPDGRRVLFYGGAARGLKGEDKFPCEEAPRVEDVENLKVEGIDIVISHAAPSIFKLPKKPPFGYAKEPWLSKFEEQTQEFWTSSYYM